MCLSNSYVIYVGAHRGVVGGGEGSEEIHGKHVNNLQWKGVIEHTDVRRLHPHLRIDWFGEHSPVLGDILHHLLQRRTLHLLPLEVGEGVGDEVEENAALSDLLDQKLLAVALAGLLQLGQLDQLPVLSDVEPAARGR